MNQEQRIDDLKRDGWMSFQPANHHGWKFFFKRDPEPIGNVQYFGGWWIYKTVFRNGVVADGIVETRHQRYERRRREILFRDFRGCI